MGLGSEALNDHMYEFDKAEERHYAAIEAKERQLTIKIKTMTVEGNIKLIGETQTFDSGFTKRQIVVTTNDMYPQEIPIDFTKDGIAIIDNYKVGDNVTVHINLRGNEHNGKYYVNVQGWKMENTQPVSNSNDDLPV